VTTMVDAGSAGYATFPGFRQFIVAFARTSLYAFLHLCPTGLCTAPEVRPWDEINLKVTIRAVERNRDIIRGIKMRDAGPFTTEQRLEIFKKAKHLAKETKLPLMVHLGNQEAIGAGNLSREMLPLMEKGDILSHVYTPHTGRVIDSDGKAFPELLEARERGVILDVARGKNNVGFEVATLGLEKGILPSTISTDITSMNSNGPVFNLPTVTSQFMALGISLEQAIEMTTVNPAKALGLEDEIGSLEVGRQADVSIFKMLQGKWTFWDSVNNSIPAEKLLLPVSTFKSGQEIIAEPTLRG
jgi:dihydroorotase